MSKENNNLPTGLYWQGKKTISYLTTLFLISLNGSGDRIITTVKR